MDEVELVLKFSTVADVSTFNISENEGSQPKILYG